MEDFKVLKEGLEYNNQKVKCVLTKYVEPQNNALLLLTDEDEDFAVCSVNLDFLLKENQVFIKNYSENTGMLNFLIENNIVTEPIRFIKSGFVSVPVCNLILD